MIRNESGSGLTLALCGLMATILVTIGSGTVWGQTALSTIRGTVTDETRSLVPGTELVLLEIHTNVVARTAVSDNNGNFEMPDLRRGIYRLEASLPGFKTFVADHIVLEGTQIRRFDIVLQVGEVSDQITVEAGAAVITTDSAEISYAVDGRTFRDNPRGAYYPGVYMQTLPGIQGRGAHSMVIFGQPPAQAQDQMDGVGKDGTVTLVDNMLMLDELKVSGVGGRADQARVATFNMSSRGGQNNFRGMLMYRHSNSALNARNFFNTVRPVFKNHKSLLETSGPIFRDRTFFFASYYYESVPGSSFHRGSVPNLGLRQGDFSQISAQLVDPLTGQPFPNNIIPAGRFSPTAQKLQDLYIPQPNAGAANALVNNLEFFHPWASDLYAAHYPLVRIDHNVSDKNSLYGRYVHRYTPYVLARGLPDFNWTRIRMHRATVISNTHVFSPALVHTLRFGWLWDFVEDGRTVDGFTPRQGNEVVQQIGLQGVNRLGLNAQGFPRMDITGFTSLETVAGGVREDDHRFTIADSVTWARGRHVWKFGADFKRYGRFDGLIPEGTYGSFLFNGRFTGHPYGDFLLGLPHRSVRLDPLTDRTRVAKELGLYAMDTFKVNERLTLDFGLRWDYFPSALYNDGLQFNWDIGTGNVVVPPEALSSVSPLYPGTINVVTGQVLPNADRRNVRPRLGFAYRFREATVIRGGYGIFTEQIGDFTRLQGGGPYQIAETYFNQITNGVPFLAFPNPFPGSLETALANVPSQSIGGFPLQTRNGSIHQFNLSLERQVGSIGLRWSYIGSRSRGMNYSLNINKPLPSTIAFAAARRPFPQFVNATFHRNTGAANYDSFQFQVQRKVGMVAFDAHYSLQSSLSNSLNRENPYDDNHWNREDVPTRHSGVINTTIEFPFGRGRLFLSDAPSVLNHILGGWQLTTISQFQSGRYFHPIFSGADPSRTNTFGGVPDRLDEGNLPSGQRTIGRWFDWQAFAEPPTGRFGNSGFNILEGPGLKIHHLSISKTFPLSERLDLEYFTRMTNVFNHVNFNNPRNNISAADPGRITSAGAPRSIEMELRLKW